jgi:hypothetical protein
LGEGVGASDRQLAEITFLQLYDATPYDTCQ